MPSDRLPLLNAIKPSTPRSLDIAQNPAQRIPIRVPSLLRYVLL